MGDDSTSQREEIVLFVWEMSCKPRMSDFRIKLEQTDPCNGMRRFIVEHPFGPTDPSELTPRNCATNLQPSRALSRLNRLASSASAPSRWMARYQEEESERNSAPSSILCPPGLLSSSRFCDHARLGRRLNSRRCMRLLRASMCENLWMISKSFSDPLELQHRWQQ
eukprot:153117-Hanusia_phi.AAC.2